MSLSKNKKNNVYPSKPQFYYIKVGFKGSKLYRHVFVMSTAKYTKGAVQAVLMQFHILTVIKYFQTTSMALNGIQYITILYTRCFEVHYDIFSNQ